MKLRTRGWIWLALGAALSLALRLPFIGLPMISDEGGYAYVAKRWLNGSGHLYHDIWVSRPQGILVVFGAIDLVWGSSILSFRLAAWLVSAATMVAVWRYGRDWAGRGSGVLAALIFVLISAAPAIEGFTANAEVFMALPSAVAAWILLQEQQHGWRTRGLLISGGLIGIAVLLKPSGIVMLPIAIAFIALEGRGSARTAIRRSAIVVAGSGAALAPAVVHGWFVGWDAFVFATVAYRVASQSSITVSPWHHVTHLASLLWHSWWLLLAVIIPFWGRRRAVHGRMLAGVPDGLRDLVSHACRPCSVVRRFHHGGADPGGTLLRLWLLGCAAGIAMGGDWWSHYLQQAAAPIAIGLAVLVRDAAPSIAPYRRLAFSGATAVLLLLPYSVAVMSAPETRSVAIFHNHAYPVELEVGTYIREHTAETDTIYIAFNSAAMYYLSDRAGAYPYLFNQELLAVPSAETELIALVSGPGRPEIVVDSSMPAPFLDGGDAFWRAVRGHYVIEAVIGPAIVYRAVDTRVCTDPLLAGA